MVQKGPCVLLVKASVRVSNLSTQTPPFMVFCVTSFLELLCAIMLYRECKILSSRIICVVNCSHNSFELRWQEIILKQEVRAICTSE